MALFKVLFDYFFVIVVIIIIYVIRLDNFLRIIWFNYMLNNANTNLKFVQIF